MTPMKFVFSTHGKRMFTTKRFSCIFEAWFINTSLNDKEYKKYDVLRTTYTPAVFPFAMKMAQ
jgi:hypothetical protein